ncbi:SDR family NAD(P)-dependent oxidoreductase [Mesorhizobium sp. M0276]|uniref:SDR family NAD(P)-dependent oxidoreductase n=1 Tax=Mesorhizobium sp. M0276 TaxID=2956928 RepID=UPI003335B62D
MYAATKAFVNSFTETLSGELIGTSVKVQALCPAVVRTEFHDIDGQPVLRPNVPVMEPEDVVEASLAGLALSDVICSPALADRGPLDHERQARHAVFGGGRGANCRRAIGRAFELQCQQSPPVRSVRPDRSPTPRVNAEHLQSDVASRARAGCVTIIAVVECVGRPSRAGNGAQAHTWSGG